MNGAIVRIGLLVLLGVCITAAGAVVWQHYSDLVDTKAALTAQVTGLKADVAAEKATVSALKLTIGKWDQASANQVQALQDLTTAQQDAGAQTREIKDVLSKHDLGMLAARKPKLVEARINAGTDTALRMLERSTGASGSAAAGSSTASAASTASSSPR